MSASRLGGNGEVRFRAAPPPAAPLRVVVEWDRGQKSFFRAGSYAISYISAAEYSLTPAEQHLLEHLRTRTMEALALAGNAQVPVAT